MFLNRKLIAKFARARRGNVAMIFGLLLIPVLVAAGVAIDFARAAQAKAVIQEASDAALLRAARMRSQDPGITDAELTVLARRIFDAATAKLGDVIISAFNVAYDPNTEAFSLVVDGQLDTSIMGVAGVGSLSLDTISEVKLGKPPYMEVVMALDNTGSMNDNNKLQSLKDSASMLVESLFEHPEAEVLVGLVPFAQYVNVGTSNSGKSWMGSTPSGWDGCVGSRNYPANTEDSDYTTNRIPAIDGDVCGERIFPLSADEGDMLDAIANMTGDGWTYIPSGLVWGWRALSDHAPFSEGISKEDLEERGGIKVLILLTDGENTKAPTYPEHDSDDRTLADQLTTTLCDNVKDDGIVLYTIAFDVTDANIRTLLEQCGTTPGHYFEPDSASELADAFEKIATSLRNLSLSK
jgi:Flp pilus assembly protein TadG